MKSLPRNLLIILSLMTATTAWASRDSRPAQLDHRVRTVMYQPDEVFKFTGHYGFQSAIELAPGEAVQTISMGDSTAWMINPVGNMLFLKPLEQDATTNMTLITTQHVYLLELRAREANGIDDPDMTFIMRFIYPGQDSNRSFSSYLDSVPEPDIENEPGKYNFNYTISGSDEIAPLRIFDDGEFTYFQFKDKNADVPAFFLVDKEGNESIINFRTRGDYIVIERVAGRFTLRHGIDVACVFNEAKAPSLASKK